MKKGILLGLLALVLAACGGKSESTDKNTPFAEADLFDIDKAKAFVTHLSEGDKKESKQLFLKAIDEYRNKKAAEKALPLFTQSLLKNPDAKTYYEYGNALSDLKDYGKAISAYHMAEMLDYSPLSKVLYNLACAYSLNQDEANTLKYLELAIQNGYTNGEHILQDPDMAFARTSDRFNAVYTGAMSGSVSPEKALFDLYLDQFPDADFPYTLTAENSQKNVPQNAIGYDYEAFVPDMRDNQFSRDVGNEFYFVSRFPKNDVYVLTLYAERGLWMENPPINYYLCAYSPEGKIIDRMAVAGYPFYDQDIQGLKITDDTHFEVKAYTTVWEKDVEEFGYEENKPVKRELIGSTQYRVNESGKFVSAKPMLGLLRR